MNLLTLTSLALLPIVQIYAAEVTLGNTTVLGVDYPSLGQEFFGGIPFAEPPIGNLRLGLPVLKESLGVETFDATNFGSPCLQAPDDARNITSSSEDCLTLNIFRPANISAGANLPVMVWIYGGGFEIGSTITVNASSLVAQSINRGTPIVYVNFNYRLGPLGFPQGQEAADKGALNLGLRDQLTALEWIQLNIGSFGGDKSKVTLFGESAGAISIAILFLNSGLENLARAAILESGSATTTLTYDAAHRQKDWTNFVGAVPECSNLANSSNTFDCLRNASSSSLLNASIFATGLADELDTWVPAIDGPGGLLPDLASTLFARGQFAKIPFITGDNLDEATGGIPLGINSSETIREWIVANYTASPADIPALELAATKILELYPDNPALGSPFNTGNNTFGLSPEFKRLSAILGDLLFHSLRRLWIQTASQAGVKTFGYLFADYPEAVQVEPWLGIFHSLDVGYVYGDPSLAAPGANATPSALQLSAQMMDYWLSFATSLDPNDGLGNTRPHWPEYSLGANLLQLKGGNTTAIPDDYRSEQISYINSNSTLFRH